MAEDWTKLLPAVLGELPLGGVLRRTDPRGPCPAPVAIVGLYPALTKSKRYRCADGSPMNLPVAVEARSFEDSASASELVRRYLEPLGLPSDATFLIDLLPYYLANVDARGGRSMADNVERYERETRRRTAAERRPSADGVVALCRSMPGNEARLTHFFAACRPALVITLGNEVAAYFRRYEKAKRGQEHLYEPEETMEIFGVSTSVVHCVHPGALLRGKTWDQPHSKWCSREGRSLVASALRTWRRPSVPSGDSSPPLGAL